MTIKNRPDPVENHSIVGFCHDGAEADSTIVFLPRLRSPDCCMGTMFKIDHWFLPFDQCVVTKAQDDFMKCRIF